MPKGRALLKGGVLVNVTTVRHVRIGRTWGHVE